LSFISFHRFYNKLYQVILLSETAFKRTTTSLINFSWSVSIYGDKYQWRTKRLVRNDRVCCFHFQHVIKKINFLFRVQVTAKKKLLRITIISIIIILVIAVVVIPVTIVTTRKSATPMEPSIPGTFKTFICWKWWSTSLKRTDC
jgi:hypothetical protein